MEDEDEDEEDDEETGGARPTELVCSAREPVPLPLV